MKMAAIEPESTHSDRAASRAPERREGVRGPRGEYTKTAQRRETILSAAVDVFSTAGFHKGSLRDVAQLAGLSQPGILHHFPSKDHLLLAVLQWRDADARSRLPQDATALDKLRAFVKLLEYGQTETPKLVELYAILSTEAMASDHPVHEYFRERYAWVLTSIRGALEEVEEAGQLKPGVDPSSAARATVAMMDGMQIQWLYERDAVDVSVEVERYLQSLLTVEL